MRTRLSVFLVFMVLGSSSKAAVSVSGDVSPTPPDDGGNVSGLLTIGEGANNGNTFFGSMVVAGGSELTSTDGIVGDRVGSVGTVSVTGLGSSWGTSDDLVVGNDSVGDLSMRSEGQVIVSDDMTVGFFDDGRGRVDVEDLGTILTVGDVLTVGLSGTGHLNVSNRSHVVSDDAILGSLVDSAGFATFSDGSTWRIDKELSIGGAGTGSLLVESGAIVESDIARMAGGAAGYGEVLVKDRGSLWLTRNDLFLGQDGIATVEVEDGGVAQVNDELSIGTGGRAMLGSGSLVADSITNRGAILGSGLVRGTIDNRPTGSIRAGEFDTLLVTSSVSNSGTIESIEGSVEFTSLVTNEEDGSVVGRDAILRFNDGLVNNGTMGFSAGETDVFGAVTNSAGGVVQIDGASTVTFYDTFNGTGQLEVAPESSAVFLGDVVLAASAGTVLAGLSLDPLVDGQPSVNHPVSVSGNVELGGQLQLEPSTEELAIHEPTQRGERVSLSLIAAAALDGTFSNINYGVDRLDPDFLESDNRSFRSLATDGAPGMFRLVEYTADGLQLINFLALEGDTDGDGAVDFGDFLRLSNAFGQPGSWLEGDFDSDGLVGFADFLALSSNFGQSANAVAVPEPSSSCLFLMAMLALQGVANSRRRRRGVCVNSPVERDHR